jgi:hypothetical protein
MYVLGTAAGACVQEGKGEEKENARTHVLD